MITIRLGTIDKRLNSTKRPDDTNWLSLEVSLKQDKDLDFPVFSCYLPDIDGAPEYNYLVLPKTGDCYWITEIRSVRNNVWEISAAIDVLASYKTDILATPAYIEYGFNTDTSGSVFRLQDVRQNVSMVPDVSTKTVDITNNSVSVSTGFYVLTAVGKQGGVTAYKIGRAVMQGLLNSIGTDITDALDAKTGVEDVLKYLSFNSVFQGSAIQAIRSCIWLPLSYTATPGGASQSIFLGDFDTGANAPVLGDNPIHKVESDIDIPWPAADWKRLNCQLILYLPFIGTVAIPVDKCNNAVSLHITWVVELLGGGVSVRVDAGDYPVFIGSANIAASYAIGSSNVPITTYASGISTAIGGMMEFGGGVLGVTGGVASAATGVGAVMGAAGDIAAGAQSMASGLSNIIGGVVQAISPVVQCAGTLTGTASCGQSVLAKLTVLYYKPIDDAGFQSVYGFPVMKMGTPVSGYCKTRSFSVGGKARSIEKQQINRLMDGGVFIE